MDYVLKPILEKFVPELYPGEMQTVYLHHDKASSHTSLLTQEYLRNLQLRKATDFTHIEDIPVKSPDTSPLDFFEFGILKQTMFNRRDSTWDGIWKIEKEVWASISVQDIQNLYMSWKRRCRPITKKDGEHIELTKKIHRRRFVK